MAAEFMLPAGQKLINRFLMGSIVLLLVGLGLVLAAALMPVQIDVGKTAEKQDYQIQLASATPPKIRSLQVKMAGRQLIRPSQAKAAVKDSGAAQKLLKKLKLLGVVQIDKERLAYISIDRQGTKSVRCGEQILGLAVQKIEPGRVTLSLQGVEVVLSH